MWVVTCVLFFYYYFSKKKNRRQKFIIKLLIVPSFLLLLWYILIAPTPWTRYVWPAMIIVMILFSVLLDDLIKMVFFLNNKTRIIFTVVLMIFIGTSIFLIFDWNKFCFQFNITEDKLSLWDKYRFERGTVGSPPLPIFNLKDQKEIVEKFSFYVSTEDKVFYHGWFLVAELSPLVNKVFFPLQRYLKNDVERLYKRHKNFLILGPYQLTNQNWKIVDNKYISLIVAKLCSKIVFTNKSYMLCELPAI
ncbi:MAG: hypothetical protein HQK51_10890, partial [Oligoflexia bacterium]|nr:hypothetical protein [Oligoflexia bacterium]